MYHSSFFLVVLALATAFVFAAPDYDRDNMAGQVPVKNTPVNLFNNWTFSPGDFSKNKGCQGKNCKSTTNEEYRSMANTYWGDEGSSDELDICDLPRDYGECSHRIIRWYFDSRDGFCRRFIYSGCSGNANNFQGRHRCQEECTLYYGSDRRRGRGGNSGGSRTRDRGRWRSRKSYKSRRTGTGGWGAEDEAEYDDTDGAAGEEEGEEVETKTTKTSRKKSSSSGGKKGGTKKKVVVEETVVEEDVEE